MNNLKLYELYIHQEASITNRTNLMLVAQSFLVVGFVEAIQKWPLQLALAVLGFLVTILTIYVGGRELEFFKMVRSRLKKEANIFTEIDDKLNKIWYLKFLGRASLVLCYYLQILFGIFWIFCLLWVIVETRG